MEYQLDAWEGGTLVSPAKVDLTTGIVTPAVYEGNTPITPERLEIMNQGIKKLYEEGAISKDIYIGPEEEAPEEAKIIIDSNQMATPVNIEQMMDDKVSPLRGKILWTNLNPTSDFATQNITLSSDDYDMLEIYFASNVQSTAILDTQRTLKGYGFRLSSIVNNTLTYREITYSNDTELIVGSGYVGSEIQDRRCVPLYIIGYKTGLFSEEV